MDFWAILETLQARWQLLIGPLVWLIVALSAAVLVQRWKGIIPKIILIGALLALAAELTFIAPVQDLWEHESKSKQEALASKISTGARLASKLGLSFVAFGFLMFSLGLPRAPQTKQSNSEQEVKRGQRHQ